MGYVTSLVKLYPQTPLAAAATTFGPAFSAGDWVRGFPVIGRHKLAASPADLALTAYLDRPLVVYGHHGDLRHGHRNPEQDLGDRVTRQDEAVTESAGLRAQ